MRWQLASTEWDHHTPILGAWALGAVSAKNCRDKRRSGLATHPAAEWSNWVVGLSGGVIVSFFAGVGDSRNNSAGSNAGILDKRRHRGVVSSRSLPKQLQNLWNTRVLPWWWDALYVNAG